MFQNRRWDGDFLTVKELLEDGALGQVARFESRFERWSPEVSKAWKAEATAATAGASCSTWAPTCWIRRWSSLGRATVVHAELAGAAAR